MNVLDEHEKASRNRFKLQLMDLKESFYFEISNEASE
jgi:hypothetical protein